MRSTADPWGIILYRAATLLAVLIALFAVFNFFDNLSEDRPIVPLFAVALAVIVWLIGFGCRYVSNARDAVRLRHDTKRV
jgi:hypothetical protein